MGGLDSGSIPGAATTAYYPNWYEGGSSNLLCSGFESRVGHVKTSSAERSRASPHCRCGWNWYTQST